MKTGKLYKIHTVKQQRQAVNSERYSDTLRHQLTPAISRKRCGLLYSGMCLQHDNARPHTARHTVKQIQDLSLEVLPHPPYSPDLVRSDFHLFCPLKDALRGRHFRPDEEVKEALHAWLAHQPQDFFSR
jgi:hypothetical protein